MKKILFITLLFFLIMGNLAYSELDEQFINQLESRRFKNFVISIPAYLEEHKGRSEETAFIFVNDKEKNNIDLMVVGTEELEMEGMSLYEFFESIYNPGPKVKNIAMHTEWRMHWDKIERMEKFLTDNFIVFLTKGSQSKDEKGLKGFECNLFYKDTGIFFAYISVLKEDTYLLNDEEMEHIINSIKIVGHKNHKL